MIVHYMPGGNYYAEERMTRSLFLLEEIGTCTQMSRCLVRTLDLAIGLRVSAFPKYGLQEIAARPMLNVEVA